MTLKSNLPQFVAEEKYTSEILDAIEPEIENIKLKLSQILLECSISTCSINGVKRFEEDYGIPYNPSLSLDARFNWRKLQGKIIFCIIYSKALPPCF